MATCCEFSLSPDSTIKWTPASFPEMSQQCAQLAISLVDWPKLSDNNPPICLPLVCEAAALLMQCLCSGLEEVSLLMLCLVVTTTICCRHAVLWGRSCYQSCCQPKPVNRVILQILQGQGHGDAVLVQRIAGFLPFYALLCGHSNTMAVVMLYCGCHSCDQTCCQPNPMNRFLLLGRVVGAQALHASAMTTFHA